MSYLLDTNVISELMKAKPNSHVVQWVSQVSNNACYISVLTLGEISKGVEGVKDQKRKEKLRVWLENKLPDWFENRILPIDLSIAKHWGRLQAEAKRPLPAIDSLLSATALHYNLRLVTRNTTDFKIAGLEILNPWDI